MNKDLAILCKDRFRYETSYSDLEEAVVFCEVPGPTELRKQLERMLTNELEEKAQKELGATYCDKCRETTCKAIVNDFLYKELKATLLQRSILTLVQLARMIRLGQQRHAVPLHYDCWIS